MEKGHRFGDVMKVPDLVTLLMKRVLTLVGLASSGEHFIIALRA
jgi:hypothetical protein